LKTSFRVSRAIHRLHCYHTDALIALRGKIRQAQNQNQQILSRMAKQQEESGTNAAARRFLDAIDTMRQPDAGKS